MSPPSHPDRTIAARRGVAVSAVVRPVTLALFGLALLALACAASLFVGSAHLTPGAVVDAVLHPSTSTAARIVWDVRVPRIAVAVLVGAALGLAGALLQALLGNPLVDPAITGVSAGASVATAIAIASGVTLALVPLLGFAAGLVTALVVLALAVHRGRIDATRLILAGLVVSAFCSAVVTIVLTRLDPGAASYAIIAWLAGTLAGHGWSDLRIALPYAAAGTLVALVAIRGLNAMRLGEARAHAVGVDVHRVQWLVVVAAALLTSSAVVLSGIVGFVGLVAPHVARRAAGTDLRHLAPTAALVGALIVLAADGAARTVAPPGELPLGALISLLGVPAFFYIMRRGGAAPGATTTRAAAVPVPARRAVRSSARP